MKKAWIQPAAAVLVAALILLNDWRLIEVEKWNGNLVFRILIYIVLLVPLLPLLVNKSRVVRTITQIFFFSAFFTDIIYLLLGRFAFSFADAINIVNNPEYASGAIATFKWVFGYAAIGATLAYLLMRVASGSSSRWMKSAGWGWVAFALMVISCIFSIWKPGTADKYPFVYRVMANLVTAKFSLPEKKWDRQPVIQQPTGNGVKHIFLIVDESIEGNAITINNPSLETTPVLQSRIGELLNFGKAISITNYSAGSNYALMTGLTPSQIPDSGFRSLSFPNIYQFAKAAGYTTYWLNAQSSGDNLQNYVAKEDLRFIDHVRKTANEFPQQEVYCYDSILATQILDISKRPNSTFTYVNKAGAHWPYENSYPRDFDMKTSAQATSKQAAAYEHAVRWNVDRFWKILLEGLATDTSALLLYTSDHGENYQAPSYRTKHATIHECGSIEGIIPLFALDKTRFLANMAKPGNRSYSQHQLFPTLLLAMNYDSMFVSRRYGRSLFDAPCNDDPAFLTGDIFGRGANEKVKVINPY